MMHKKLSSLVWLALVIGSQACSEGKPPRDDSRASGGSGGGTADSEANAGNAGRDQGSTVTEDDIPVSVAGEFPIPLKDGLAPTPPMGWSSWNKFACDITAKDVKAVADAMVDSGMKAVGYQYVNIDDCWQAEERAPDGTLLLDPDFPEGMKALADYVHERGLKLGLYSTRGTTTCAGRAGSEGYEAIDAKTYAEWGVDYLKYDNCPAGADAATIESGYKLMRQELDSATDAATNPTARPIVYSLCAWQFYEWGTTTGQLWRTTKDITANWEHTSKGSVISCTDTNSRLAAYAGPNGWNDPDMLEIGNGGMTVDEQRSHMNLWAMMASPLIAGNNIVTMDDTTKEILTNSEVIAVNQDAYGLQGIPVQRDAALLTEVWAKPLNGEGERALLLFNRDEVAHDITVDLLRIGLGRHAVSLTELWSKQELGEFHDSYTAKNVAPHASLMLKATGIEPNLPAGRTYLSDLTWLYGANGLGPVERDQTNGNAAAGDGEPIEMSGQGYEKGLGIQAPASVLFRLGKACSRFTATIGATDDIAAGTSVVFRVYGDDELLYESPTMTNQSTPEKIDVSVEGKYRLKLFASNAGTVGSGDRVVWADAQVNCD
jgi:alpha-galactosidase